MAASLRADFERAQAQLNERTKEYEATLVRIKQLETVMTVHLAPLSADVRAAAAHARQCYADAAHDAQLAERRAERLRLRLVTGAHALKELQRAHAARAALAVRVYELVQCSNRAEWQRLRASSDDRVYSALADEEMTLQAELADATLQTRIDEATSATEAALCQLEEVRVRCSALDVEIATMDAVLCDSEQSAADAMRTAADAEREHNVRVGALERDMRDTCAQRDELKRRVAALEVRAKDVGATSTHALALTVSSGGTLSAAATNVTGSAAAMSVTGSTTSTSLSLSLGVGGAATANFDKSAPALSQPTTTTTTALVSSTAASSPTLSPAELLEIAAVLEQIDDDDDDDGDACNHMQLALPAASALPSPKQGDVMASVAMRGNSSTSNNNTGAHGVDKSSTAASPAVPTTSLARPSPSSVVRPPSALSAAVRLPARPPTALPPSPAQRRPPQQQQATSASTPTNAEHNGVLHVPALMRFMQAK